MKTTIFALTCTVFVTVLTAYVPVSAEELTRKQVEETFQKLLDSGRTAYDASLNKTEDGAKVSISDSVATAAVGTECRTGVKIWFQLAKDGSFVNPTLHRWDPGERFKIFILTPVPAYVALFQNYAEDRPASRQIYPDKEHPETFCAVPPGKPFALPVNFKMDDDMRSEILSLVISRVDEPRIGGTTIVQATATAAGSGTVTASATASVRQNIAERTDPVTLTQTTVTRGVLMSPVDRSKANDFLTEQNTGKEASKVSICSVSGVGESRSIDDVSVYVLGTGRTAQFQMTLSK
ncbi:MAG: DUF4384 domain-containing protein [Planctomycetaceae bacterium]|jgi:PHD/YefM family antitoxin component YafN of YafNO toxin-antitoxin module|nr:DUF4384 domain-containing protein [Planctomycetaceae bacterium]